MKSRIIVSGLGLLLASACGSAPSSSSDSLEGAEVASSEQACSSVNVFTTTLTNGDQADVYHPTYGHADDYPTIAFLQGALTDKSFYSGFARELAGEGYVVVVANHFQVLGPPGTPPQLFTSELVVNAVQASMTAADADPASPLYQIVDTNNLGVSGHSFGGVAALYSVQGTCTPPFCFGPFYARPPQLHAAAVYGTNTVNQAGVLLDLNTSAAPVALLQGSVDGNATPARAALTFGILETPKALITLDGLNHWGIADQQNPPGAQPDLSPQTRPQEWGISKTAKYAAVMFDAYLKGDNGALKKLRKEKSEQGVTIDFVEN
jgi:dienelactone hydrolase